MRFSAVVFAASLVVSVPVTATAASLVFEGTPGQTAAWKLLESGTGVGTHGYWDRTSYDSAGTLGAARCAAGTLVAGLPCDWVPRASSPVSNPEPATPGSPVEYFGLVGASAPGGDSPLDFYFTGPFTFDWTVLFQLTAWSSTVEFGWYEAGAPDVRTPLLGPGGPFTTNDGSPGTSGRVTVPAADFGFYYRNTRFGEDVMFFTQSRFNRMGAYFSYFAEPQFNGGSSLYEDEQSFERAFDLSRFQQFVVFRQGDRYWVGLEDQFGQPTGAFCNSPAAQPCSDYDFNDLIIAFDQPPAPPPPVPEPTLLALLATGMAAAVARRRRP